MLIEDDDAHAEITTFAIEAGFPDAEVTRFRDGEEALSHMRDVQDQGTAELPQVMFVDINMHGIDGLTVLEKVRAEKLSHQNVPKVMLTTSASKSDRARARSLCANGYLVKPMEFSLFQSMMKSAIDYWTTWNVPFESEYAAS